MNSYKQLKNIADEVEKKNGPLLIQEEQNFHECLNAVIANIDTDIKSELTQIGEAFGKAGFFGRRWRVRFYYTDYNEQRSRVRNSYCCAWLLETKTKDTPVFEYENCVEIRLNFEWHLFLHYRHEGHLSRPLDVPRSVEDEVIKKIQERLSELNRKLDSRR